MLLPTNDWLSVNPAVLDAALDPISESILNDDPADADGPRFSDMALPATLLRAAATLGFSTPTAIQEQAIPALLAGRDITGVAQTGTGKTAAFGLPLLAAVDPTQRGVQALVLTPTRELAMQVAEALGTFAQHMPGLEDRPGLRRRPVPAAEVRAVRGRPGCRRHPRPGIDHLERRTLNLSGLRFLVLDEADEMLRMGFAEDVDRILSDAPRDRQTALFSATMPPAIRAVAATHMTNPVDIAVSRQSSTHVNTRQTYAVVPFRDKVDALARILEVSDGDATIVFVRTKGACDEVGAELIARGVSAAAINGDVPQKERERIIDRLRTGKLDVLVATDVAARGLDVDRIDLVVNFDAPGETESYVHRIGRTGRAGRMGTALTFFTPREVGRMRAIEKATRVKLEQITPPTAADVAAHRADSVLVNAVERVAAGRLDGYRTAVAAFAAQQDLSMIDLAATLLALAAGDDGKVTEPTKSSFAADRAERAPREFDAERPEPRRKRADGPAGPRYRVAVGRNHGVRPAGIVGAITGEGGINGKDLGRIDIFDTYSLVEIAAELSPAAFGRIAAATVSGQKLRIQLDAGGPPTASRGPNGPRRTGPGREPGGRDFNRDREYGHGTRSGGQRTERRSYAR